VVFELTNILQNTIIFLDSLKPANLHSFAKRLELVSRDFFDQYINLVVDQ
jgi:hypothetical protein